MSGDMTVPEAWLSRLASVDGEPLLESVASSLATVETGHVPADATSALDRMTGGEPVGWRLLVAAATRIVLRRFDSARLPALVTAAPGGGELALCAPLDADAPVSAFLGALHAEFESAVPIAWTDRGALLDRLALAGVVAPLSLSIRVDDDVLTPTSGLTVTARHRDGALTIDVDSVSGAFPAAAHGLAVGVAAALTAIAEDPHRRCLDVDVLGVAQRERIRSWSGPERPAPFAARTLTELVDTTIATGPHREALTDGTRRWTYAELDRSVHAAAALMRERPGVVGGRVAVLLPRGPELVITILAALRAGASYVPLDPSHPSERLARQLRLSGASLVVTVDGARLVDGDAPVIAAAELLVAPPADVASTSTADGEAVLFFTSGSTGAPRPVALTHRQLAHKMTAAVAWADFDDRTRFAMLSAISSDALTYQIFVTLTAGGCLVSLPSGGDVEPAVFWADVDRLGVTAINCVPSLLAALVDAIPSGVPRRLRHCLLGGDDIPSGLLPRLAGRLDVDVFGNLYGPTEATVEAVSFRCAGADWPALVSVPIGRPSPGFAVELLGADDRPVPIGVPGEIVILGPGVATGYLDDEPTGPGRFVPVPDRPDTPAFRTGDQARWRPDGALEFLGRGDDQIQIHGNRVEPAEVEAAFAAIEAIAASAVVTAAEPGSTPRLIGAYVPIDATLDTGAVRSALAARLPAHMIPTTLLSLGALPLTVHGKVDRRELLRLADTAETVWEPEDDRHRLVADAWTEVLGRPPRHGDEEFLSAGGHSLTAMILTRRLCELFGDAAITVRQVFAAATPNAIAAAVAERPAALAEAVSAPSSGRFPAGSAQRRMWFLEQYDDGESRPYNMVEAFRIDADFSIDTLRVGLAAVIARHGALRTTLVADGERLDQIVAAPDDVVPSMTVSAGTVSDEVDRYRRHRFDLGEGPLWAVTWIAEGPDQGHLVLCVHHAVCDGWSIAVMLRDLLEAVESGRIDRPTPLPYSAHTGALSERLDGDAGAAARDYWHRTLANLPDVDVSMDRHRPPTRSSSGGTVRVALEPAVRDGLRRLCGATGATPFAGVVAAVRVLLHRLCGHTDIPLGSITSGRDEPRVADSVGLFANTIVLRSPLDLDAGFRGAVAASSANLAQAMTHQDYPFDQLVSELGVERATGRNPVFDVLVESVFAGLEPLSGAADSVVRPVDLAVSVSDFDLVFGYDDAGVLLVSYRDDVFDRDTIERTADQLARLLSGLVAEPDRPVSTVELLPDDQRRFLVRDANDTAAPFPESSTLLDLVHEQVRRHPDRTAVAAGTGTLTFAELDARAEALAAHLASTAVTGPDRLVALACERTEWMVVALLAILKTGSAFMPVDPEQPSARLRSIVSAAKATAMLSDLSHAAEFGAAVPVVIGPKDVEENASHRPAASTTAPGDLAYVVHTSGSTGVPKGVMVEHRGIVNTVHYRARYYDFDPGACVLQVPPIHFDSGINDVFSALIAGARVVVMSRERLLDADEVAAEIERHRVTHVMMVPSLYQVLLDRAAFALRSVRQIVLVGERLPRSLAERHARLLPSTVLYNEYGPAEDSVWTTVHLITDPTADVLIGHPIANKTVDLLDAEGRLVPVGRVGEICIGGVGVARGYLNDPQLTASRFVDNPVRPGTRMYRTGDLATRLPSGLLRYLGRADDQVKIRGQRVEPGEVAAVLSLVEGVVNAAVLAVGEGTETRLVAYVVGSVSEDVLRTHVAERLPAAMRPHSYVAMTELPVTVNGKLDRGALPVPPAGAPATSSAAFTEAEAQIASVWTEVLGLPVTDPDANLFELGGHSLVAARIAQLLGVPVRTVMEHQTVRLLAVTLGREPARATPAPERVGPAPRVFPLSRTQRRIWLAARRDQANSYIVSDLVRLGRRLDPDLLASAAAHVVSAQSQLRVGTRMSGGEIEQVVVDTLPDGPPLIVVDLPGEAPEGPAVTTALAEAREPGFDLARPPLWELRLLRGVVGGDLLTVTAHHLIYDGASVDVLIGSLLDAYDALDAGREPPGPSSRYDFADWVAAERAWLESPEASDQRDRLVERLTATVVSPDLLDANRRQGSRGLNRLVRAEIDWATVEDAAATPYALTVAAFVAMVHRQTGATDLTLGFPVSLRDRAEADDLVGCFVNAVPLRVEIDPRGNLGDLLEHVRERVLEAYEHARVPFDDIVGRLRVTTAPGRSVLYDLGVTWENATVRKQRFEVEDVLSTDMLAHSDLWLYAARYGDRLRFDVAHDLNLVTADEARHFVDAIAELATAIATRPGEPLAGPPIITADSPWSDTHYDF
ncbi:amino acid adenylation domain-containing protein [Stackebrandtia soli]|uniref:amino acid adenylation domain-containing protein n=1 Tax=Stackebrandtia soli TaxID=1892856 RepID=UPI0039EB02D2